jgi:xanthine dehydrogenase large subunit
MSAFSSSNPSAGPLSGQSLTHDSAALHVSGRAQYLDDIPVPADCVHLALGQSAVAHGRITALDLSAVAAAPGVLAVFTAADIPGENNFGAVLKDDPVFAAEEVLCVGQPIFAVAATSHLAARRAVALATVSYEERPALLDVRSALAAQSFVLPTRVLERGDAAAALAAAPRRLQGSFEVGGQEHFYLEGQAALALPQDDGGLLIHSSTQHPTEVQQVIGHVLGLAAHRVTVQCRRMGGGFGGKESQPALFAAVAALAAVKLGRPAKLRLDRDADMTITGKRHDFVADYDVGFDASGRLLGLDLMIASRCGYSADLSAPVNDRAVAHVDNAYFLSDVRIVSHRCKTHTVSNTAFRGFGGPQGMMMIEAVMDAIARDVRLDPLAVRRRNFYALDPAEGRHTTPYGQVVEDNVLDALVDDLLRSSDYAARRAAIDAANASSPIIKRGLALTPLKFGISFNATHFNQAGALVQVYADGSVLLNHGGLEMGQGLHTKVSQVVADEFGLPREAVRVTATDTAKVPNTSATAASSGTDLNGKAAQAAARTLRERMAEFLMRQRGASAVRFAGGQVLLTTAAGEQALTFAEAAQACWMGRISLSATGFYATPKIHWDGAAMRGRPFFYFAYGAAVAEVALDTLTGEHRLLRVDILHDVGRSLNPAIDRGQIEGGFLQGLGWLTCEELCWDERGRLRTHAPSTYKIPAVSDWPEAAHIRLLQMGDHRAENREDTIFRSKAVGEPPFMLAMSVFFALRDAVASAAGDAAALRLVAPATPEALLRALGGLDGLDGVRAPA